MHRLSCYDSFSIDNKMLEANMIDGQEQNNDHAKTDNNGRSSINIDYDKLADAIVKAQMRYDEIIKENNIKKDKEYAKRIAIDQKLKYPIKIVLKDLARILAGKQESDADAGTMVSSAAGFTLNVMACFIRICACIFFAISINSYIAFDWTGLSHIISGILNIAFTLLIFLFMLYYAGIIQCIAKRIILERDKNFVIAVFDAFTGFIALIVACIAIAISIL